MISKEITSHTTNDRTGIYTVINDIGPNSTRSADGGYSGREVYSMLESNNIIYHSTFDKE